MTARDQLLWARRLLERGEAATLGVWPRASALLARHALEQLLDEFWALTAPPVYANARAQLIALHGYEPVRALAAPVSAAWGGLSRGCHHHPYDLPPTRAELDGWIAIVEQFHAAVARAAGATGS